MHTLSCYFLLNHHFQAVDDSFDTVSLSSNSINDDNISMSDFPEDPDETINNESKITIDDVEPVEGATINPDDEENQFIYDENSQLLICVGSTFNEIPQIIIEKYASKTKVKLI